jgi:hypothetical protein
MPPLEKFEQEVRALIGQGCIPLDSAIQQVQQTYPTLVQDANQVVKIKQRIARDLRK